AVLDEYLDNLSFEDPAAAGRSAPSPSRIATPSLFWFEGTSVLGACRPATPSGPVGAATASTVAPPAPPLRHPSCLRLAEVATPPAPRVPRVLTPAERQALDQFIGLGARIDATFTM